jgi:head-tail adaptor
MPISRSVLRPRPHLSAGQRDQPVLIEQLTTGVAGSRSPVDTWTTLRTREWMSKEDLRANERFAQGQQAASTETLWEMEYAADMDPDLVNVPETRRLVHMGRIYNITAASTIGAKRGIELLTLARVQV